MALVAYVYYVFIVSDLKLASTPFKLKYKNLYDLNFYIIYTFIYYFYNSHYYFNNFKANQIFGKKI